MEDRRCKLGQHGRRELVKLAVAAVTAHRWWTRWKDASADDQASLACLRTRSSQPGSCPWRLIPEQEHQILEAREKTNYGPLQLQDLICRHRSAIGKVLVRHGVSRQRRTAKPHRRRGHAA